MIPGAVPWPAYNGSAPQRTRQYLPVYALSNLVRLPMPPLHILCADSRSATLMADRMADKNRFVLSRILQSMGFVGSQQTSMDDSGGDCLRRVRQKTELQDYRVAFKRTP